MSRARSSPGSPAALNLNELPERQPEIVFDHGPRFRDGDDE